MHACMHANVSGGRAQLVHREITLASTCAHQMHSDHIEWPTEMYVYARIAVVKVDLTDENKQQNERDHGCTHGH